MLAALPCAFVRSCSAAKTICFVAHYAWPDSLYGPVTAAAAACVAIAAAVAILVDDRQVIVATIAFGEKRFFTLQLLCTSLWAMAEPLVRSCIPSVWYRSTQDLLFSGPLLTRMVTPVSKQRQLVVAAMLES